MFEIIILLLQLYVFEVTSKLNNIFQMKCTVRVLILIGKCDV